VSEIIDRLVADGFLRRLDDHCVAAPRWHAAVARAAKALMARGEDLIDLRAPVAWALNESYADESEDELVEMIAVMTPLTGLTKLTGLTTPPPSPRGGEGRGEG